MKSLARIRRVTVAACALATATATLAQDPALVPADAPQAAATTAQEQRPRYGFGISTDLFSSSSRRPEAQGLSISAALLRGRLRIEPELGFYVARQNVPSLPTSDSKSYSVGVGLLFELSRAERSALYTGGRLGFIFAESGYGGSRSGWSTGETLSAVLGGEYFLAPFVGIGLEALAGVAGSHAAGSTTNTFIASTSGLLVLRFYGR